MAKGADYEWVAARKLSLWLTGGEDKNQFRRSAMSGGWGKTSGDKQAIQIGDLGPQGPVAMTFLESFGVEVKASQYEPNWWSVFTSEGYVDVKHQGWEPIRWWKKICEECFPRKLTPLLIVFTPRRPTTLFTSTEFLLPFVPPITISRPDMVCNVHVFDYVLGFLEPEYFYTEHRRQWGRSL